MRVTKPRKEFGDDNFQMIEKEANESTNDLRVIQKGAMMQLTIDRKQLEIGLQAANKMQTLQTQTYYNRSVNAQVQYEASDFIDKMRAHTLEDSKMDEKLDKFIDRVAYRVEEALQSNEIINVFQFDFEMLADDDAATGAKANAINAVPRTFFEQGYCKNKSVSCIKFHPTMSHIVGMSLIENLSFEDRTEVMGKSYESHILILNFQDSQIIHLKYALCSPVEISCIEFHPQNPKVLIAGSINGQLITWDLSSTEHRIE